MAEKYVVVQGAICKCNFGTSPDKLKILTNSKEYANDHEGCSKLIASTKDVGATFEKNTFGSCAKQKNNPCSVTITEWKGFYEKITLANQGKILLNDSTAGCPIGGAGCITIVNHGQTAELSKQNLKKADPAVQQVLNPAVNIQKMIEKQHDGAEITIG